MNASLQPDQPVSKRLTAVLTVGLVLFVLLLVLFLYTFTHESGHALVGMLFGGRLVAFNVNFFNLSAHAGIDGNFTPGQNALIGAAGVSLPLILCAVFLILAPRKANSVLEWFRLCLFMGTANTLLAWIVIPFLVAGGQAVADDSANFVSVTHFPAVVVSGGALAVYLAAWALFLDRVGGLRGLIGRFRTAPSDLASPAARRTFVGLAALGVVVGLALIALQQVLPDPLTNAPVGYQLQATADLTARAYADENVYRLTLDQPATVSLFIALRNVKGTPVAIRLSGPDGYNETFLNMKEGPFDAGQATVNPKELALGPGEYELRITFQQCRGLVKVYSKVESD